MKTNLELVTEIMEFGSPMNQVVVIQALDYYCKTVIEQGAESVDSPLLNGEAYVAACEDILKTMEKHYE